MSHHLYTYGQTDPVYFKLTLNSVGVDVTLATDDIQLIIDGGTAIDVTTECAAIDGTNLPGLYKWTPSSASRTQGQVLVLYIRDDSAGGAFDENMLIIATGGHADARFSG